MRTIVKLLISAIIIIILVLGYFLIKQPSLTGRSYQLVRWFKNPENVNLPRVQAGSRCGDAPFQQPTDGIIGYIWDDSFRPGHHHQGIDIFGGSQPGSTPVYSVYDGYLTRLPDWKSTVIIRIPEDPLNSARQIWTYYTHFADEEGNSFISNAFPPGTSETYVTAGTLLGYQGNFSGTPGHPVGVHLHFSIVKDDGTGQFLNELDIKNTLDPSPYFQMNLNANLNPGDIPECIPIN